MARTPLAVLTLLGLGGAVLAAETPAATEASSASAVTITFKLKPQNQSGQSGTATLVERSDGTFTIKLRVTGPVTFLGPVQIAHIHTVTCAKYARMSFGAQSATIAYGLKDLRRGRSITHVDVPLAEKTTGKFAINVHEQNAPWTVVACGNIPKRKV